MPSRTMTTSEWSHPRAGLLMKLRLATPVAAAAAPTLLVDGAVDECCISAKDPSRSVGTTCEFTDTQWLLVQTKKKTSQFKQV